MRVVEKLFLFDEIRQEEIYQVFSRFESDIATPGGYPVY